MANIQPNAMRSFKAALHYSVHHSQLAPKAIAEALGVGYSAVMGWCEEEQPDKWIPGRRLIAILPLLSDKTFAAYLASMSGGDFHEVPGAVESIERPTAEVMARTGDVLRCVAAATAATSPGGPGWTPEEHADLKPLTDAAIDSLRTLEDTARRSVVVRPRMVVAR